MSSVGHAMPRQIVRVMDLLPIYAALPSGELAVASMRSAIDRALVAWERGDVAGIVETFKELQAWA